jgi:hypothetical protein
VLRYVVGFVENLLNTSNTIAQTKREIRKDKIYKCPVHCYYDQSSGPKALKDTQSVSHAGGIKGLYPLPPKKKTIFSDVQVEIYKLYKFEI